MVYFFLLHAACWPYRLIQNGCNCGRFVLNAHLSFPQFQSHQIFHVLVVAAAFVHFYGVSNLQEFRYGLEGGCTDDSLLWDQQKTLVQSFPSAFAKLNNTTLDVLGEEKRNLAKVAIPSLPPSLWRRAGWRWGGDCQRCPLGGSASPSKPLLLASEWIVCRNVTLGFSEHRRNSPGAVKRGLLPAAFWCFKPAPCFKRLSTCVRIHERHQIPISPLYS